MRHKWIAPVIAAGLLAGGASAGLTTTGIAGAATTTASSTSSTSTATHPTKAQLRTWWRAHRKQIRRAVVLISAKAIGITPRQLVTELKAGNSIAGVASQHGVSSQTVVNDLVAAADSAVNKAVTAGKLTAAQAKVIEARLPARVTKVVNHTF